MKSDAGISEDLCKNLKVEAEGEGEGGGEEEEEGAEFIIRFMKLPFVS